MRPSGWRWGWLALALVSVAAGACAEGWWGPLPADRRAIVARYGEWQRALAEERIADAYVFMTPTYRADHSLEKFDEDFSGWGDGFFALQPDCYVRGTREYAYVHPYEVGFTELMNGPLAEWEKVDGVWMFTGEVDWFVD